MKRLILDLDGTITRDDANRPYPEKEPNLDLIVKLREYREQGFEIVISTARNMATFNGNLGKINAVTLPLIVDWLKRHDVPFDEIIVGKPWCGRDGFYVDDKSIRPDEFVDLSYDEIARKLNLGGNTN